MEMGKVPTPNGGLVPPIFFYSKTIETGWSRYGVSTEHTQKGASLGGRQREKECTVQSFIRSLDGVTERT